ncbi:AzlC family ABC transporter permease [Planktotalea sp.]|uniref:AzlC family ABC transporter permease n=1 Tax=Planktotalea sp. TaxID=2029877 RepID=UPI0032979168
MSQDDISPIAEILLGARDMLPMTLAASTYGIAFGLLATQSGFSLLQILSMSAFVYGGSAQLVALDQLVAGAGVGAAVLAGAALNMRVLLITASMRDAMVGRPWWQVLMGVYLATDASIALMQTGKSRRALSSYWYLFGGGTSLLIAWIFTTSIGGILSKGIPDPTRFGLDFALVAVFVAMLPGLWRGRADILPWIVAGGTVLTFATMFPAQSSWALILGAVLGGVTAGVVRGD